MYEMYFTHLENITIQQLAQQMCDCLYKISAPILTPSILIFFFSTRKKTPRLLIFCPSMFCKRHDNGDVQSSWCPWHKEGLLASLYTRH